MNAASPLLERLTGDRPALVADGRATSAGQLGARTAGLAAWLSRSGVSAGDRALLLVPSGADFAAAFLALVQLGAVPVLIEPGQAPSAWGARLAAAGPRWVVADPRLAWVWRVPFLGALLRRRGLPIPPAPTLGRRLVVPRTSLGSAPIATRSAQDEALLVFTSGTTSAPKSVVHTHGNLPHFLCNIGRVVDGLPVGTYLAETPQQIFYALLLDATCHVVRGVGERRIRRTLDVLQRGGIEAWFGSPWTWTTWLRRGLPLPGSLRTVLLGSAPVTRPFLRTLVGRLPGATVRCVYGLTEAGPVCFADAPDKLAWAHGGDPVGRPLPGMAVRVDDGRVSVGGRAIAPATGPWLDTGDLGFLRDGALALTGRAKDMIVRRGVNLYPGLLEPALLDHVDDAAIVGVWDADRQDERVVVAWVGDRLPELTGLLGEAAPDHVLRLDALPRSGRQHKVDKAELRRVARARFGIPA